MADFGDEPSCHIPNAAIVSDTSKHNIPPDDVGKSTLQLSGTVSLSSRHFSAVPIVPVKGHHKTLHFLPEFLRALAVSQAFQSQFRSS